MFFRQRAAANATMSHWFGCTGLGQDVAVDGVAGEEDRFVAEAQAAGVRAAQVAPQPMAA